MGKAQRWVRRRFYYRCCRSQHHIKNCIAISKAEWPHHQGWLGASAIEVFIRSAGTEECNAPGQLQPQLAHLGKSDFIACQWHAGCKANHWRRVAHYRMA